MLLPLQGVFARPSIPRVPVPLRVTSALGYGLVGLSGRTYSTEKSDNIPLPWTIVLLASPSFSVRHNPSEACLLILPCRRLGL